MNNRSSTDLPSPPFPFAKIHHPLAPHTLYRIGGPARIALFPSNLDELQAAYRWVRENDIPFLVMGGGSNMLIDDCGYAGVVLFTTALKECFPLGNGRYDIGAGVPLAELVSAVMLRHNYSGVGALTGIPGTVGGGVFMNAGTANGSICQWIESVRLLTASGLSTVPVNKNLYSYRGQCFCTGDDVIAGAIFAFAASENNEKDVYHHYMQRRLETQPKGWCCGSVFKNPPDNHAGRLIEAAGLKGTRKGGAVISEKHANFIMNDHNASFEDVLYLIQLVKDRVRELFGISLVEEVRVIRSR